MLVKPSYYDKFKCAADACRHTCCVGWEIDIDAATLHLYENTGGNLGKKLAENISVTPDGACFRLDEKERCPFLLNNGLCEIISELGEDALCEICTLHPRFRNFYDGFLEVGLGLCCEEAAALILLQEEPFSLVCDEAAQISVSEEDAAFLDFRNQVFLKISDRKKKMTERMAELYETFCKRKLTPKDILEVYISLERLDEKWSEILSGLSPENFSKKAIDVLEIPFEQLMNYFIFRHLKNAFEMGNASGAIAMAVSACMLIDAMCVNYYEENGELPIDVFLEFVRMYSCEVEYSEDNTNRIFEELI